MKELEQLYNEIAISLKNYVLRLCANQSIAEEIMQQTFLIALEHIAVSGKPLSHAWFFTVARNLYFNYSKKERRIKLIDEVEAHEKETEELPETELQRKCQEEQVKDVLEKLNKDYREILVLREFQCLSYSEIAHKLGLSIDQVKVNLYRARARFRQLYERSDFDEL